MNERKKKKKKKTREKSREREELNDDLIIKKNINSRQKSETANEQRIPKNKFKKQRGPQKPAVFVSRVVHHSSSSPSDAYAALTLTEIEFSPEKRGASLSPQKKRKTIKINSIFPFFRRYF